MLKMLKFDFYKLFKSKSLLILFIVTLCLSSVDQLVRFDSYNYSALFRVLRQNDMAFGILWIFVVPFVAKDLSSKYIKNIYATYTFADKIYYILSKVIFIFVYCIIFYIVYFVLALLINLINSAVVVKAEFAFEYIDEYGHNSIVASDFFYYFFSCMMSSFAIGACLMFLCTLLKKEYFVIVIALPYLFILCNLIYDAIDRALDISLAVERYSVFGMYKVLVFNNEGISGIAYCPLVSFGYSVLFTVLSWLSFFKRSF